MVDFVDIIFVGGIQENWKIQFMKDGEVVEQCEIVCNGFFKFDFRVDNDIFW